MLWAPPRLQKPRMQRKAATAVMSALIWLLVCPGLHAAKPTRTLTRPPARLVATPSSHRSARDWSMHPAAAYPLARSAARSSTHRAARAIEPTVRTSARKASSRDFLQAAHPTAVAFDRRDPAWQRAQRDAAARDAILAAARATSSPAATRLPGDGTATGDEDSPAMASAQGPRSRSGRRRPARPPAREEAGSPAHRRNPPRRRAPAGESPLLASLDLRIPRLILPRLLLDLPLAASGQLCRAHGRLPAAPAPHQRQRRVRCRR